MTDAAVTVDTIDEPAPVEAVIVDSGTGPLDVNAVGRPDPNVRTPERAHAIRAGDRTYTASFFSALPGGGEDVWQFHDITVVGEPQLAFTVVADHIADAVTEDNDRASRMRAEAARLVAEAGQLDARRALLTALADQEGVDVDTPAVQPAHAAPPAQRSHPAPTVR